MAEAGVNVQTSQTTGRFFCHKCNEELSRVLEDFTCPKCKCGFVEKLSDATPTASHGASSASTAHGGNQFSDASIPFLELLRGFTRDMEVNVSSPSGLQRSNSGPGSGARSPETFQFVMDMRPRGGNTSSGSTGTQGGHHQHGSPTASAVQQPAINPMENMLFSFLNDLITGLSGGGVTVGGAGGGIPMIANIGDYVWGRDGLDAIVTQLMNQMEGTGPPPMPSDKIDTLPTVKISQEQVERKLQCSVCWDDFSLNEDVKQLECDHVFHPDCIVPWLKLHGTCPICRKDLTNQEDVSATPSARFEPPGTDNSRGQGQSGSGSSNRGNNDLDRMDYDFD